MTREEQIREASATTLLQINCDIHEAVISAFQDGARWADNNPDTSSLWHDANEEPKEGMDILYISQNGKVHKVSKIDQTLYDWLKDNDGIDKWAYISDLLPKGGLK